MICVFEGPDGSGKSTLVAELARQFGEERTSVWCRGPFPEDGNPWTEYFHPLSGLYPSADWLVVMDRWHIGELVYGPLLRGGSRLSAPQRDYVDTFLHHVGAIMVYLTASSEEIRRRLADRGDDLIEAEQIPAISLAYDRAFRAGQTHLTVRRHDTTGQRTEPFASSLLLAAELESGVAMSRWNHPSSDKRPFWEVHEWPS